MNILGLDMSSKKTGFSLFCDGELIDYGCWELSYDTEKDWRKRILFMSSKLDDYFDKHKIDKIIIEDCPPSLDNTQTLKVLSALQGCVLCICNLHNIEVEFVSVATWKKIVGIDLTHSREFIARKREYKGHENLSKFKNLVKAYEKKMSVDYVNNKYNTELIYKSPSSQFNNDDISDAILLVSHILYPEKYSLKTFDEIMDIVWEATEKSTKKRGG